ncbi:MAG: trypsin-like peptidase domain-containing protein [Betaproteobacteria bacterium]|nr:trypsin-like peptidase domain-containing protein [Betaproteobacteria bacterium]
MPFHISQPSHQSLFIEMKANGHTIACGTAFVARISVGVDFLLTNRHNVTGRDQETGAPLCKRTIAIPDSLTVWHNARSELGRFVQVDVPLCDGNEPRWIEHPELGPTADVVALPIAKRDDICLYPYKVESLVHMQIQPAQRVSVIGFPFGERTGPSFAVWATGFIASEPEIDHGGRPVFLIDCRSRKGQSGSPVIRHRDNNAEVPLSNGLEEIEMRSDFLGMYSGRINAESDLGVVWKAHVISELLEHANVVTGAV